MNKFLNWKSDKNAAIDRNGRSQDANEPRGLTDFRKQLRNAALAEEVPMGRLKQGLRSAVGQEERRKPYGVWLAPVAAATVIFAIWFWQSPYSDPNGDRAVAAAEAKYGVWMPRLDLSEIGRFDHVSGGNGVVNYHFKARGEDLVLSVANRRLAPPDKPTVRLGGMEFVVDNGLCWTCPTSLYKLQGGDEKTRNEIAQKLAEQTGNRRLTTG